MSIEQVALVGLGGIVNSLTFAMGITVGIALCKRKDSLNDNGDHDKDKRTEESGSWHIALPAQGTAARPCRSGTGCSRPHDSPRS